MDHEDSSQIHPQNPTTQASHYRNATSLRSQQHDGVSISVSVNSSVRRDQINRRAITSHTGARYYSQTQQSNVQSLQENNSIVDDGEQQYLWGTNFLAQDIERKFEFFLMNFNPEVKENDMQIEQEEGQSFYMKEFNQCGQTSKSTLTIDAQHVYQYDKKLYRDLIYFPAEIINLFDQVAKKVYEENFNDQEDFNLCNKIQVDIVNLQKSLRMRDLNPNDINHLVSIKGIVIRCSNIYPEMTQAIFKCNQCDQTITSSLNRGKLNEPTDCENCKTKHSYSLVHNMCFFTDKQFVKIQESPENVPEGETPHSTTLIAYDSNNVDSVKPGDRIEAVGIYRAQGVRQNKNRRALKSVYNSYIDVISYARLNKQKIMQVDGIVQDKLEFTEEDKQRFYDIASTNKTILYDKFVRSLAPSIFENKDVKKGLLCQLFGGSSKSLNTHASTGRFRPEINCLLVGDPSVAKSQLLTYVNKLAPRGIYTSGKGSSAVGLTAYVRKDPETKDIVLESGALVLSDLGICCIDEFDKMDDTTRSVLHEAMEQQTISVARAGIVAQLNCRTAILAGANPIQSRYNPKKSVVENINLPPTLMSRFDLIYILLDQIDSKKDKELATHILSLYLPNAGDQMQNEDIFDKVLLQQYISYARQAHNPKLNDECVNKLKQEYVEMRKRGQSKNVITSTPRQLESMIRISEAIARMRLSDEVTGEDVEEAIRLIKVSTLSSATDPETGQIDMNMINTGIAQIDVENKKKMIEMIENKIKANRNEFVGSGYSKKSLKDHVMNEFKASNEEDKQRLGTAFTMAIKELTDQNILKEFGSWKNPNLKLVTHEYQ